MILLAGGNGSIGRRYQAILKSLNIDYINCEMNDYKELSKVDKVIIATNTDTHITWIDLCIKNNLQFLCEKPLSRNLKEAQRVVDYSKGYLVNNYKFLLADFFFNAPVTDISYDYYNSGKDGLIWDICQLVYLAYLTKINLTVKTESPIWEMKINDISIPFKEIEKSYIKMMKAFLTNQTHLLWDLKNAVEQIEICKHLEEKGGKNCESFNWYSSSDEFEAPAR